MDSLDSIGTMDSGGGGGSGTHKLKGYIQVKHGTGDSRRRMLGKVSLYFKNIWFPYFFRRKRQFLFAIKV